jgi:hypothetical protein
MKCVYICEMGRWEMGDGQTASLLCGSQYKSEQVWQATYDAWMSEYVDPSLHRVGALQLPGTSRQVLASCFNISVAVPVAEASFSVTQHQC